MKRKLREWLSIQVARNPGRAVLVAILLFNIAFLFISALIISGLSLSGTEKMGFLRAAFCTVTMILDAGCIQFVVSDIGSSGVAIAVICLIIIIIGMVSFTGAVIGYITNYISGFIESTNAGSRKLSISGHLVILNWNTRASEIVNDLLYCKGRQKVVVLTDGHKAEIVKEVNERLADTIARENLDEMERLKDYPPLKRLILFLKRRMRNNIVLIVREGDVFSSKQLHDISLERARSVVILGSDRTNSPCKYEQESQLDSSVKGNALTVKTLMQVSDITAADYSDDNQKIIVEISDEWTWKLVERIIKNKQVDGKCNIVPVRVNQILGQILSQFSLMPELNYAYRELFSNKGATFFVTERKVEDDNAFINDYISNHADAIPLTSMRSGEKDYFYYVADNEKDIHRVSAPDDDNFSVKLNYDYWIEKKYIIILGHNSRSKDLMTGFCAFRDEWNYKDGHDDILNIIVIDDEKNLEKMDHYREYPFVTKTVAADIYDTELICGMIDSYVDEHKEDTSILILSDDSTVSDNIDANTLANLVYAQDTIAEKKRKSAKFDTESIDLIVEIIDPKHHDILRSYSVNNVVISNRYISKMITQIGEKEAIFSLYTDILTYDDGSSDHYTSKEIYTKKVSLFFKEIPGTCTQKQLIDAVWKASTDPSVPEEKRNPTIVLGFVKPGGKVTLFGEGQKEKMVTLEKNDKIIVFTNH